MGATSLQKVMVQLKNRKRKTTFPIELLKYGRQDLTQQMKIENFHTSQNPIEWSISITNLIFTEIQNTRKI